MVGGQDELVFDGNSLIINEKGALIAQGKQFEEELIVADLDVESVFRSQLHDPRRRKEIQLVKKQLGQTTKIEIPSECPAIAKPPLPPRQVERLDEPAEIYQALVLGTRDYVRKNGFKKVVIGLSGGVDSSLVAAIAVEVNEVRMILIGGLNPVAAAVESGIEVENHAMSTVVEYRDLIKFWDL
ncbi:unnamed protein product [marine sediment metagenome]|uniref:CN hydrolase domain-containing protein n=1 Tax=marine sediment metagenome TaxID=412755 RepID=X1PMQ9_9ZZZZ